MLKTTGMQDKKPKWIRIRQELPDKERWRFGFFRNAALVIDWDSVRARDAGKAIEALPCPGRSSDR
jgi:hypothetical protein